MAKGDAKREKEERRAREELERGLARGNAELVLDALVAMSASARDAHLARSSGVVGAAVAAAMKTREVAALTRLAVRFDREPRLFAHLPCDATEARWAMLWACGRAGDFARAERLWRPIAAEVAARGADLARAVEAYLVARGRPAPSEFAALFSEEVRAAAAASRPAARPKAPALPDDPEQAVDVMVGVLARKGWGAFAESLDSWRRQAPPAVAAHVRVTAAELGARELLIAECAGRNDLSAASVVARAAEGERIAEVVERIDAAVLIALRLVLRAHASGREAQGALALTSLVRQATRSPLLRAPVAAAVAGLVAATSGALDRLLGLLPELFAAAPSAALWVRAVVAIETAQDRRSREQGKELPVPPAWVERALPAVVAEMDALHVAIAGLEPRERATFLRYVDGAFAPARRVDLIVALWDRADAELRRDLARLAADALHDTLPPRYCGECDEPHPTKVRSRKDLSPPALTMWQRLEPLVVAYDPLFLSLASAGVTSRKEMGALFTRFTTEGEPPIENFLITSKLAQKLGHASEATAIRRRMMTTFHGQPQPLARGLAWALRFTGARSVARVMLAEALVEAVAKSRAATPSDVVADMLPYARRIVLRTRKASIPRGKQLSLGIGGAP